MTCAANLGSQWTSTGTATVVFSVQDSYGQSASTQATVTIVNPPPPTLLISSQGTQSVVVDTAISPVAFSVTGTGPLTVSASASPATIVALTAGCGITVMNCTASLGSAPNTPGLTTLTLTVQDGYGQSAAGSASVTVLKPAPPTIEITAGGSQTVNVDATIAPVSFTLAGSGALTVTAASTQIPGPAISAGCGTTALSCTATLGSAQNTPGTATLTLTVNDAYGQSAAATASIDAQDPPKSGGGALDRSALLGLAGLAVWQRLRSQRRPRRQRAAAR